MCIRSHTDSRLKNKTEVSNRDVSRHEIKKTIICRLWIVDTSSNNTNIIYDQERNQTMGWQTQVDTFSSRTKIAPDCKMCITIKRSSNRVSPRINYES